MSETGILNIVEETRKELVNQTEKAITEKKKAKLEKDHVKKQKFLKLKESLIVKVTDNYEKPPAILYIKDKLYGTLGNISLITGKSKSKKTMNLSMFTAGLINPESVLGFTTDIKNAKVLYFDTEQGDWHAHSQLKRIFKLSKNVDGLEFHRLRNLSSRDRYKFIRDSIKYTEGVSLVIIDGIADLLTKGVNNEEEATKICDKLLKWSYEKNLHIISILHQNKALDNKHAKGHIGSYLTQKSETVLSVERCKEDTSVSKVEATYSRNGDIDDYYITLDENVIPYITEEPQPLKKEGKKTSNPYDYDLKVNYEIIKEVFTNSEQLINKDLHDKLVVKLDKYNRPSSYANVVKFITYSREEDMILQEAKRKPYTLNKSWVSNET